MIFSQPQTNVVYLGKKQKKKKKHKKKHKNNKGKERQGKRWKIFASCVGFAH